MNELTLIGTLDHDLTAMAGKIHQNIIHGSVVVWADKAGEIWHAPVPDMIEARTDLAASSIVGSYMSGASMADIEGDLREVLRERKGSGVIEGTCERSIQRTPEKNDFAGGMKLG